MREPSNIKNIKYQLIQFVQQLKFKKGIHQIPNLTVLTLDYRLVGREASQAKYSAAGPVVEISRDI